MNEFSMDGLAFRKKQTRWITKNALVCRHYNYLLALPLAMILVLAGCTKIISKNSDGGGVNTAIARKSSPTVPIKDAYFRLRVVDQETSRGIPCVQVKLANEAEYWTDSAGVVAFYEPDMMNQEIFFAVRTHGYRAEENRFFQGAILKTVPGGTGVIPMRRINIAQRLYRMTGTGIYRDSVLLGDEVPPVQEAGKIAVAGQDGGDMVRLKDKYYWFWGDSVLPRSPLGVFKSVGAVSDPPDRGGLNPEVGVAYRYMRGDERGEVRGVVDMPGTIYWYTRPRVTLDKEGREHLMSDYSEIAPPMVEVGSGLMEFNEARGYFELARKYPGDALIKSSGDSTTVFKHTVDGKEYFYFAGPYPAVRWPSDYESQKDLDKREFYTCLKEGSRFDGTAGQLDRNKNGALRWGWKRNTSPVVEKEMDQLIEAKAMKPAEQWYSVRDVKTGKRVQSHQGSVYWNEYRKRFVCIRLEFMGDTPVGEVWYLEGDTPQGPWIYGQKIISHAWRGHNYSFYVPAQLPEFDKDGGRVIFIKGAFSAQFGDEEMKVPGQNYNVFLYKLELDDPRLALPVPIYSVQGKGYGTKEAFAESDLRNSDIGWFAQDRPATGTIGVYQISDKKGGNIRLSAERPKAKTAKPLFYAMPADAKVESTSTLAQTALLVLDESGRKGALAYKTTDGEPEADQGAKREPICRVWRNPILFNPYANEE